MIYVAGVVAKRATFSEWVEGALSIMLLLFCGYEIENNVTQGILRKYAVGEWEDRDSE